VELRDSSLRVDPGVWVALQSLIAARKADARALLNVSEDFELAPSEPASTRFARRVLAVDAALRALLLAPIEHSDLESRFFASAEHVLRRLAEQHVIFYNHDLDQYQYLNQFKLNDIHVIEHDRHRLAQTAKRKPTNATRDPK
jgi:hypothetical protein